MCGIFYIWCCAKSDVQYFPFTFSFDSLSLSLYFSISLSLFASFLSDFFKSDAPRELFMGQSLISKKKTG
jgi:hypothetical protein